MSHRVVFAPEALTQIDALEDDSATVSILGVFHGGQDYDARWQEG